MNILFVFDRHGIVEPGREQAVQAETRFAMLEALDCFSLAGAVERSTLIDTGHYRYDRNTTKIAPPLLGRFTNCLIDHPDDGDLVPAYGTSWDDPEGLEIVCDYGRGGELGNAAAPNVADWAVRWAISCRSQMQRGDRLLLAYHDTSDRGEHQVRQKFEALKSESVYVMSIHQIGDLKDPDDDDENLAPPKDGDAFKNGIMNFHAGNFLRVHNGPNPCNNFIPNGVTAHTFVEGFDRLWALAARDR